MASSLKDNKFGSDSIRMGCGNIPSRCNRICGKSAEPPCAQVGGQAKVRLLDTLMTYHIIIAGLKRNTDFNNSLPSEYALAIMDRAAKRYK